MTRSMITRANTVRVMNPTGVTAYAMISPSYVSTRIFFGLGCAENVADILSELLVEQKRPKIMLLTGMPSAEKTWITGIENGVRQFDHVTIRNRVSNPTIRSVAEALQTARREQVDAVVAVGGGSVLDTGKAVAALTRSTLTVEQALASKTVSDAPLAYLALPTTSGTGSEVTCSASIWDDRTNTKHSLSTKSMYPDVAMVDPLLGASMPRTVVAGTGFDALSHAIESAWSINSTDESIKFGLAAIELIMENLERSVSSPDDHEARINMARASLWAGLSIAQAQTTIAHAISYPLTARYGVHHGHACGLSVGALLSFNNGISPADCQDPRGYAHVRDVLDRIIAALGAADAVEAEARILNLIRRTGLKTFDKLDGINLDLLARDVVSYDRFGNNPRRMSGDQLDAFLNDLSQPLGH